MKVFIVYILAFIGFLLFLRVLHIRGNVLTKSYGIISGQNASEGQFPWQVVVQDTENRWRICGGSLISEQWVLSSAHCFDQSNFSINLNSFNIILGTNNISSPGVIRTIKSIAISNYSSETFANDIALIKLSSPVNFNQYIKKIDLIPREWVNAPFLGSSVLVSGFGYTSDTELRYSENLQYTQMEILHIEKCIEAYGHQTKYFQKSTICAGPKSGTNQNICKGDSGGAMIILINGLPFQIGVNTFVYGKHSCSVGKPSGFQHVGYFYEFIEKIIIN